MSREHQEIIDLFDAKIDAAQWRQAIRWDIEDLFWLAYGLGFDEGMREADLNHERKGRE